LGCHFFGEALCEWLTLCPKMGPLPQTSQTFGMALTLFSQRPIYTTNAQSAQISAASGGTKHAETIREFLDEMDEKR
jgi:hypothetical protein